MLQYFFWRLTSSLLQDDYEMDQLYPFFDMIEKDLQDIFGPRHQRLVMHCLSKVVLSKLMSDFTQLRRNLENQVSQWLLFGCNLFTRGHGNSSLLACEMEYSRECSKEHLKTRISIC